MELAASLPLWIKMNTSPSFMMDENGRDGGFRNIERERKKERKKEREGMVGW